MTKSIDPTEGRVYGGAVNLIHIADGERQKLGVRIASALDQHMRMNAVVNGSRSPEQAWGDPVRQRPRQSLCPGCYMVAIVATAVELAQQNGQSITELGRSLSAAFKQLEEGGLAERNMEWIDVLLDPPESTGPTDADIELAWTRATLGGYPL